MRLDLIKALMPACLLFLCSFSSLPACAQNNNGNNSGWVQQPNSTQSNAYYTVWDWTGLTFSASLLWVPPYTFTVYSGGGDFYYGNVPPISGTMSWSGSISGTVTNKWLWTPQGGNLTTNPPPPLFVLQRADMSLLYYLYNPSNVQGLAISGPASDGLGDSLSVSVPPFPSPLTNINGPTVTGRAIQAASGTTLVSASVSPSLSEGVQATNASGAAYPGAGIGISMYPIVLTAPNPLGRPDLGDGSNQYVMTTRSRTAF